MAEQTTQGTPLPERLEQHADGLHAGGATGPGVMGYLAYCDERTVRLLREAADALREREQALRRLRDAADTVIDFAYRWSMEDGHHDMCILLDGADECNCGMDALRDASRSLSPEPDGAR